MEQLNGRSANPLRFCPSIQELPQTEIKASAHSWRMGWLGEAVALRKQRPASSLPCASNLHGKKPMPGRRTLQLRGCQFSAVALMQSIFQGRLQCAEEVAIGQTQEHQSGRTETLDVPVRAGEDVPRRIKSRVQVHDSQDFLVPGEQLFTGALHIPWFQLVPAWVLLCHGGVDQPFVVAVTQARVLLIEPSMQLPVMTPGAPVHFRRPRRVQGQQPGLDPVPVEVEARQHGLAAVKVGLDFLEHLLGSLCPGHPPIARAGSFARAQPSQNGEAVQKVPQHVIDLIEDASSKRGVIMPAHDDNGVASDAHGLAVATEKVRLHEGIRTKAE